MARNKGVWLLAIYLFLAVYLLPMFPHGGSANELTRWATAASLIEKGSFEISWTESLIGKNVDTATVGAKIYSNKAPGPAMLAAPFYGLTRIFIGEPSASNIRISWFVMRFAIASMPLFLLGLWLYKKEADEFSLATLLFATPLFLYSLLLFSHVLVGVLVYFAFRLIYDNRVIMPGNSLLAGALCGLAVISEFPAIFAVATLGAGILLAAKRDRLSGIAYFVLGGLPFAVLLLIYNYSLFGSPLSMSYAHESFPEWAEVAGQGVFGIGLPSISNVFLLLFSPLRGLIFTAPILVLSIFRFFTSQDSASHRHRVKIATIIVTILFISGHGAAHGGWAFSARYLVFIIPLFLDSLFDHEAYEYSNLWQGLLFGVSILLCAIPVLTFPFAPPEFRFPHNDFWVSFLMQENWYVPNTGNVFGMQSSVWSLIPVVLALAGVVLIVCLTSRRRTKFAIGFGASLLLVGAYVFWPLTETDEARFRRATIAERYFIPANRLDAFREQAVARGDSAALRRVNDFAWNIADVRAFVPDDFPYLASREFSLSPTRLMASAVELQKQSRTDEAEQILKNGKTEFPFAACEFSSNLAVIYYSTNRKDLALAELEQIQPLVNKASRPDCLRSQFLLGSLYREMNRPDDANKLLRGFLLNSESSTDTQIREFRRQLIGK